MFPRRTWLVMIGLALLAFVSFGIAQTAANTVPTGRASNTAQAITPNDLKPADCAALNLTTLYYGDGDITTSGSTNDLVLGGPAAQSIRTRAGDDCIVAGGGDDSIRCDQGTDVAIGGPGTDTFNANCETQIQ